MLEVFKTWGSSNPKWRRIRVEGPDAADFLNRLTTTQTIRLAEGKASALGFLLNGKAQILGQFWISRPGPNAFHLEFDPGKNDWLLSQILSTLDGMHFGEDLIFSVEESKNCLWVLGDGPIEWSGELTEGKLFQKTWRRLWGERHELEKITTSLSTNDERSFHTLRTEHLFAWVDWEIRDGENLLSPLEIGQHTGVDRDKGCYPGQEVIEKIYTYGSPSRRLIQFHSTEKDLEKGTTLTDSTGAEVGWVTTPPFSELGIGIVKKNFAQAGKILSSKNNNTIEIKQVSNYGKDEN